MINLGNSIRYESPEEYYDRQERQFRSAERRRGEYVDYDDYYTEEDEDY